MSVKQFISPDELYYLSCKLGKLIADASAEFKPTFLVALWRGGAFIGISVQEFLNFKGIPTDHICIRTSSYEGQVQREIRVHNLHYIVEKANANDNLIIVDDIFDSGRSIQKVIQTLKEQMRANLPQIRVATVFYKPQNNKTDIIPDYYCETTSAWIVFPHETEDLDVETIRRVRGDKIADLFA